MAISSMTGFGAASGTVTLTEGRTVSWAWELKGVNGRGFDLRLRAPSGFDALDPIIRAKATGLKRGTVSANLNVDFGNAGRSIAIDDEALKVVADGLAKVHLLMECAPARADGILGLKGVITVADESLSDAEQVQLLDEVAKGFDAALASFISVRDAEGARLAAVLSAQVEEMARLTDTARDHSKDALDRHHQALRQQIAELLGESGIGEERLAQEAAVIAVRTDIQEEIDRLDGHVAAARQHLKEGGTVGRRLDFLAQEFVREANTLTTKASDMTLKKIGLDLKVVIDQFKEQVQNIA